ncbi:venom metalloproteinase antarease TserMP_A-like [Dermacentor variabilis]|uniref:venom metalloproteinase antarease TserMP_A-like n=1 Tax=Dermacentor variabilis TaxID=34621 RepID=UPI003F5B08B6
MYVPAGNHIYRLIALLDIVGVVFSQLNGGRIVYPELFRSREADGGCLLKITDDILLKLKKSSVLEREFLVRTYSDGIPVHTYMSGPYLEDDLYHDEASMASVTVSYDSGLRVEGIVTPRMRIAPLSTQERSADGRVAHELIEIQDELTSDSGDYDVAAYPTERAFNRATGRNGTSGLAQPFIQL